MKNVENTSVSESSMNTYQGKAIACTMSTLYHGWKGVWII